MPYCKDVPRRTLSNQCLAGFDNDHWTQLTKKDGISDTHLVVKVTINVFQSERLQCTCNELSYKSLLFLSFVMLLFELYNSFNYYVYSFKFMPIRIFRANKKCVTKTKKTSLTKETQKRQQGKGEVCSRSSPGVSSIFST